MGDCDSCGERTATPPDCEDCRAGTFDDIAERAFNGRWRGPSDVQWLVAEVDRLRTELARRGEEMDAARAKAVAAEEALDRIASGRSLDALTFERDQLADEVDYLRGERDRLAAQVDSVRDLADAIEEVEDGGGSSSRPIVADLRRLVGGAS